MHSSMATHQRSSTSSNSSSGGMNEGVAPARQARFFLQSPTLSSRRPSHFMLRSDLSTPGGVAALSGESSDLYRQSSTESDTLPGNKELILRRFVRRQSLSTFRSGVYTPPRQQDHDHHEYPQHYQHRYQQPDDGQGGDREEWSHGDSADVSADGSHQDIRKTLDDRLKAVRASREREIRILEDQMDALVDIHETLYRGFDNYRELRIGQQSHQIDKVLDRWFEGDCVYDHPFVKIPSRQCLNNHFTFLHILSSFSLPSPTPTSLLHHVHNVISQLRSRLTGDDTIDVETGPAESLQSQEIEKGKQSAETQAPGHDLVLPISTATMLDEEWYGLPVESGTSHFTETTEKKGWLKIWDVRGECSELGIMECYDGYHLAMIDQVMTLTFLPNLLLHSSPRSVASPLHPIPSTSSFASLDVSSSTSLFGSIAACLAREFDYLLRWDLRIRTIIEFNEVGKVTHLRDTIDIQDFVEAAIPFAKRIGWVTRRLSGLLTSSVGTLLTTFLSPSERRNGTNPISIPARPVQTTLENEKDETPQASLMTLKSRSFIDQHSPTPRRHLGSAINLQTSSSHPSHHHRQDQGAISSLDLNSGGGGEVDSSIMIGHENGMGSRTRIDIGMGGASVMLESGVEAGGVNSLGLDGVGSMAPDTDASIDV